MSDTPIMDAAWLKYGPLVDSFSMVHMIGVGNDLEQRLTAVTAERDELRFLLAAATNTLRRYRNESPPGHQPHMICHVADEIIAKSEAALRGKDAEK